MDKMPRLITLEELKYLKKGSWVWIEIADCDEYPGGGFYHCELADIPETIEDPYTYTVVYLYSLSGCERFDTAQSGWRLWTDKPTKKLAKATKWKQKDK